MMIFKRLLSPPYFFKYTNYIIKYLPKIVVLLSLIVTIGGLIITPDDYQQFAAFRIIYLHVPLAIYSLSIFFIMTIIACLQLIWKNKILDYWCQASAVVGMMYTFLALATGSIWGRPMWGSFWVWDARLTSELILFFLYVGYLCLRVSINNQKVAIKVSSIFIIFASIDVPIVHYSVKLWSTLHQQATISKIAMPSISFSMLWPLIVALILFLFFYILCSVIMVRTKLINYSTGTKWIALNLL